MCGRFSLGININDLPLVFNDTVQEGANQALAESATDLKEVSKDRYKAYDSDGQLGYELFLSDIAAFKSSYNIAPTNDALIIYAKNSDSTDKLVYIVETLKFGLVPMWAKPKDSLPVRRGGKPGPKYSKEIQKYESMYFNCRKETLAQKKAIWNSCKNNRCVIPIQGYFEWLKKDNKKIPYFISDSKQPLVYLAGFYSHNTNYKDVVEDSRGYISSFTVVTGPADKKDSKDLSWLHNRKPLLVAPASKEWFDWLNPKAKWSETLLSTTLDTINNEAYLHIQSFKVSKDVGNPTTEGAYLIREDKGSQKSIELFLQSSKKSPKRKTEEDYSPNKRVKNESHSIPTEKTETEIKKDIKEENEQKIKMEPSGD
ncbi:uncharacterized protein PRCAT00000626001 [Priceomyces carsonii]|uniref:uncharacterized protein n=1 Tax=Priceomyces carsonii TaxID=28549 RepID=UPI002ED819BE|nr:unnamed protein product [Priceomyces carsonii]